MLAIAALVPFTAPSAADSPFVRPAELEADIGFWRRIYTEVTTEGGLLHDADDLGIVYDVLEFPSDVSPRTRSKRIEDAKKKYARILDRLASGATDLSEQEIRIQDLWPQGTKRSRFEQAAESVRFQLGQSDRFREGIVRSGAWREHIADTFERMGLPRELAALPHVESSFNTYAYSKVGAAGMWQFMRSTGRRFLRIDGVMDERLDPYRSTEAAARFLEQNYIVLGSWPLALTAYNHGPGGMRRAQAQLGTSDIATVVRKYN
ncbi:MAG: lytic transglycosylase domain-containing protein, partial [Steroidobacteraceae bacterium]